MAISNREQLELRRLANKVRTFNDALDGSLLAKVNISNLNINALQQISGADLSAVPGSFATLAAVQTYLATLVPEIETRLDNIEAKINQIINA